MSKKGILVRLEPDKHKSFVLFCVKNDTSAQRTLEEYIDMILSAEEKGINFADLARGLFHEKVEGYDKHEGSGRDGEGSHVE